MREPSGEKTGLIFLLSVAGKLYRLSVGEKLDVNLPRADERAVAADEGQESPVRG